MLLVQVLQVKYVQGLRSFICGRWSKFFQRESIFCDKISSGESLFIEKLVPGGTNFGGSIFTMTVVPTIGPLWASAPQTPQAHLIRYYPTYRLLYLGWRIATFTHPPSIIHHWMHIQLKPIMLHVNLCMRREPRAISSHIAFSPIK